MRTTLRMLATAIAILAVAGGAMVLTSGSNAAIADEAQETAVCTLKVSGMTCGGCAAAVKRAAKKVDGVTDAKVSHENGIAEVTYDPAKTNPKAIAQAITDRSGFRAELQTGTSK